MLNPQENEYVCFKYYILNLLLSAYFYNSKIRILKRGKKGYSEYLFLFEWPKSSCIEIIYCQDSHKIYKNKDNEP